MEGKLRKLLIPRLLGASFYRPMTREPERLFLNSEEYQDSCTEYPL